MPLQYVSRDAGGRSSSDSYNIRISSRSGKRRPRLTGHIRSDLRRRRLAVSELAEQVLVGAAEEVRLHVGEAEAVARVGEGLDNGAELGGVDVTLTAADFGEVGSNDEFDADFLLHLKENPDWAYSPKEYLRAVRAAFLRHPVYKSMVSRKNRCVRITYANSCHVDIVPYITLADGREVIVNYAEDKFEDTNPTGFTTWMKEKDDLAGKNLRLAIRLLKYIRDYKNTFRCPSVILTTLLGQRVSSINAETRYSSVANTLVHLLEDLVTYLDGYWTMPNVEDPSCPGTGFTHRWDEDQYQNFKTTMRRYAKWAREAVDAEYPAASEIAWRRLFGDAFVAPEVVELAKALEATRTVELSTVSSKSLMQRAPGEQFIDEEYPVALAYMARVDAYLIRTNGRKHPRPFRSDWHLPPGRTLRFEVHTDTPGPYTIIWKVRNRGEVATRLGKQRGRLIHNSGWRHTEATRYRGLHYVDAYIVRAGVVVATDRVLVNII